MKFIPNVGRVLVKPLPAQEKTAGGIIIPDTAKEKPLQGIIAAIGPMNDDVDAANNKALNFQEGDVVLYGKYSGTEVQLANEEYLIVNAKDILGVLILDKQKQNG